MCTLGVLWGKWGYFGGSVRHLCFEHLLILASAGDFTGFTHLFGPAQGGSSWRVSRMKGVVRKRGVEGHRGDFGGGRVRQNNMAIYSLLGIFT